MELITEHLSHAIDPNALRHTISCFLLQVTAPSCSRTHTLDAVIPCDRRNEIKDPGEGYARISEWVSDKLVLILFKSLKLPRKETSLSTINHRTSGGRPC